MDCAHACVRNDNTRFCIIPLPPIVADGSEGIFMPQHLMPRSITSPAILSILCSISSVAISLPPTHKEYAS